MSGYQHQNVTAGLQSALQNYQGNLLAQDKLAQQKEQDAAATRYRQSMLGISQAREADRVRALEQSRADSAGLKKAFQSVPTEVKSYKDITTAAVPAVADNTAAIAAITKGNKAIDLQASLLDTEAVDAAPGFDTAYNQYITNNKAKPIPTVPVSEVDARADLFGGSLLPGGKKLTRTYTKLPGGETLPGYVDEKGNKDSGWGLVTGYDTMDTGNIPLRDSKNVPTGNTANSIKLENEAYEHALKQSGLGDILKRIENLPTRADVPKKVAAQAAQAALTKTVVDGTKPATAADKRDAYREAIRNSGISGKAMSDALKDADKVFPDAKGPSITEQIALAKHSAGLIGDAKTIKGYRSMFPNMPKEVTTVEAAKAWAIKQNKKGGKGFNFSSDLYAVVKDGTDSGDIEAIDEFLIEKADEIKAMNSTERKTFLTRFQGNYADQGYWDLGDILSMSTAAGTALSN